jgi:hypothetical protein
MILQGKGTGIQLTVEDSYMGENKIVDYVAPASLKQSVATTLAMKDLPGEQSPNGREAETGRDRLSLEAFSASMKMFDSNKDGGLSREELHHAAETSAVARFLEKHLDTIKDLSKENLFSDKTISKEDLNLAIALMHKDISRKEFIADRDFKQCTGWGAIAGGAAGTAASFAFGGYVGFVGGDPPAGYALGAILAMGAAPMGGMAGGLLGAGLSPIKSRYDNYYHGPTLDKLIRDYERMK